MQNELDASKNVTAIETTVFFLRNVRFAMEVKGSRSLLDIFTDRVVRSVSESTLSTAMEHLMRSTQATTDRLSPVIVARMARVATSADAPRVLRWLRDHTRLAVMLSATNDQALVSEALAEVTLDSVDGDGVAAVRQPFDVPINVTCESPLAHGADGKAGNATLFRRIDVIATNGAHMVLPYYSGNAVRGQLRDLLADHFLEHIGLDNKRLALWFFYALYSGGTLEEKSDASKNVIKNLGDNGATRSDGILAFRNHFPALSLLGCALGNRVLPGRIQVGDLRPRCREWGTGDKPVSDLLGWEFLTRREDDEDHADNHSMITTTEVLVSGNELAGGIDMGIMTDLERACLGCGLRLLAERGFLGAENRRGLGRVRMTIDNAPDEKPYLDWLASSRADIIAYMTEIDAFRQPEPDKKKKDEQKPTGDALELFNRVEGGNEVKA